MSYPHCENAQPDETRALWAVPLGNPETRIYALADAELVWPDILADAAAGELRPVY